MSDWTDIQCMACAVEEEDNRNAHTIRGAVRLVEVRADILVGECDNCGAQWFMHRHGENEAEIRRLVNSLDMPED